MKVNLDFEPVTNCPVCNQSDSRPVFTKRHMDIQLIFHQCANCGVFFLNPRMTDECTTRYYAHIYREATAGSPEARELDRIVQKSRASIQAKLVVENAQFIGTKPGRHLEIGSSAGFLLEAIGAEYSIGIEPNELYQDLEPAKNYTIHKTIGSVKPQIFDLISMSHSLEHINHPTDYLKGMIHNYTVPGSYIMVEVPDVQHNSHDALLLHHPVAYDHKTLTDLFTRVGCKAVAVGYHGLGSPFALYLIALFKVVHNG